MVIGEFLVKQSRNYIVKGYAEYIEILMIAMCAPTVSGRMLQALKRMEDWCRKGNLILNTKL